jgi:DNA-directed RNA polymerase subunit omega
MDILNDDKDLASEITSRYTIVIAAAKRARQIVNGAEFEQVPGQKSDKAVSVAVGELSAGRIKLYPDGLPPKITVMKQKIEQIKNPYFNDRREIPNELLFMDEPEAEEMDDDFDDEFDDLGDDDFVEDEAEVNEAEESNEVEE